jgi:hypothetical protein
MCECTPGGADKPRVQGIKTLYPHALATNTSPRPLPLSIWREVCKLYFVCITYPEDRLPALSGLSRVFQKTHPDVKSYMAGLWSKDLPKALLWWCELRYHRRGHWWHPIEVFYVVRHSGAPTWSWASLSGQTDVFELTFTLDKSGDLRNTALLCYVIGGQCTAKGLDAFSATTVGKLTLVSPVASAHWE